MANYEPYFTAQPRNENTYIGVTPGTLHVSASAETGEVSYQWYRNGFEIPGAVYPDYVPDASRAGKSEYYAVASTFEAGEVFEAAKKSVGVANTYRYVAANHAWRYVYVWQRNYGFQTGDNIVGQGIDSPPTTAACIPVPAFGGTGYTESIKLKMSVYTPNDNRTFRWAVRTDRYDSLYQGVSEVPDGGGQLAHGTFRISPTGGGYGYQTFEFPVSAPMDVPLYIYLWSSNSRYGNFHINKTLTITAVQRSPDIRHTAKSDSAFVAVYSAASLDAKIEGAESEYFVSDEGVTWEVEYPSAYNEYRAVGTVSYQWYKNGEEITGATGKTYNPSFPESGVFSYHVEVTNTVGVSQRTTTTPTIPITVHYGLPIISSQPNGAYYRRGERAADLSTTATSEVGELSYQWFLNGTAIPGATESSYTPSTAAEGDFDYYCRITNGYGSYAGVLDTDTVTIQVAPPAPHFVTPLTGGTYQTGTTVVLNGTAEAEEGTIRYQWYSYAPGEEPTAIPGETSATYTVPNGEVDSRFYYVIATNVFSDPFVDSGGGNIVAPETVIAEADGGDVTITDGVTATDVDEDGNVILYDASEDNLSVKSNVVSVRFVNAFSESQGRYEQYLNALKTNFTKAIRLDFLNRDGSVAFSLSRHDKSGRSGQFQQTGDISCNLQNGPRRQANVVFGNESHDFDYSVGKLWFGQEIRLMEGLVLPDGSEYLLPQGIFSVKNPEEIFSPARNDMSYPLVDKWSNLDGTLGGNLDGDYQVNAGEQIFDVIASLLRLDRFTMDGNGENPVDTLAPIFTSFYNTKTQRLTDGSVVPLTLSPYDLMVDGISGSLAEIILGMADMLSAWVGYNAAGRLTVEPSQDDVTDTEKPVLWDFSPTEEEFLGATYTIQNADVFNDIIVCGATSDSSVTARGRAQNRNPASDTCVQRIGLKTKTVSMPNFYSDDVCKAYAAWLLKQKAMLSKSITITSSQMFHIRENSLVTIHRIDKPGSPVEKHLVTGFSRPLSATGQMTITAVSCNDLQDIATIIEN